MRNSLKNRVLSWFLIFSFLTILIIIPFSLHHIRQKESLNDIIRQLDIIQISLLRNFKNQNDFFIYETTNPAFFESGESRYISLHNDLVDSIKLDIEKLLARKDISRFGIEDSLKSTLKMLEKQDSVFMAITGAIKQRGFKDYGLVGDMRKNIHQLEDSGDLKRAKILSLRRHEKDYIIRRDDEYVTTHAELGDEMLAALNSSNSMSWEVKQTTRKLLQDYLALFKLIVQMDKQMGLDDNSGMKEIFNDLSAKLEGSYKQLVTKAKDQKLLIFDQLEFYYLTFSVFIVLLSIVVSVYTSRKISHPLMELNDYINNLVKSGFKSREKLNLHRADDEIRLLFKNFQTMVDELHSHQRKLEQTARALSESEKRFRQLADLLPQSIFELDKNWKFTYVNKAFLETLGYSKAQLEFSIRLTDILNLRCPQDLDSFRNGQNIEAEVKTGEGKILEVMLYASQIMDGEYVTGLRCAMVDISKRKQYIKKLEFAKNRAEEADKLKSAFLANMSHEIRTPMNSIIGFADLLYDDESIQDEKREYLSMIRDNGKQLLKLINDIVDMAKIEAGQMAIKPSEHKLNELVDSMGKFLEQQIILHEKKQNVRPEIYKELSDDVVFKVDVERFKQVVINLINNAVKFTDEGVISFGYGQKNSDELEFYVKDTGMGISKDKLNDVFQRFKKIDNSRQRLYRGAGLGLNISRNLIELMGGSIRVESEPGEGTTFYFSLPFERGRGGASEIIKTTVRANTIPDWGSKRLLIVEDDNSSFNLLRIILKRTNIKIQRSVNGQEALSIIRRDRKRLDLVLMDIQMPILSGEEVLHQMQVEKINLPVIAQTAYAMAHDRERLIKAGFCDYISKPVSAMELLQKIGSNS